MGSIFCFHQLTNTLIFFSQVRKNQQKTILTWCKITSSHLGKSLTLVSQRLKVAKHLSCRGLQALSQYPPTVISHWFGQSTRLASLLVWYHYISFLCYLGLPGLTQWSSSEAYFL
ncbi:hypothetical protein EDC96DRAFT_562318 [Choanephora cucurbitarum]|nr:hypothetical protein EDC96DRAFT_562318 [Choanephora cucurbitarum]